MSIAIPSWFVFCFVYLTNVVFFLWLYLAITRKMLWLFPVFVLLSFVHFSSLKSPEIATRHDIAIEMIRLAMTASISGYTTVAAFFAGRAIFDGLSQSHPQNPVPVSYVLFEIACLTVLFAIVYAVIGLKGPDLNGQPQVYHDFWNCLYFSVMTITTVGYGDFSPTPYARPFAASQAASGYVFLALMIALIANRLQEARKPKKRRRY